MKHKRLDVLFLGHDASRTGAPIMLLRLMQWLKEHTDLSCGVVLKAGGELEPDYAEAGPCRIYSEEMRAKPWLIHQLMRIPVLCRLVPFTRRRLLKATVRSWSPRVIYANTLATGELIDFFSVPGVPVVTHVHELEMVIRNLVGRPQMAQARQHTDRYIAVSQAVRKNLISEHGIDSDSIEMIPEFLPVADYTGLNHQEAKQKLQKEFSLPEDAFIVGASGTPGWRKGSDIFVYVASQVVKRRPEVPVRFIWVGGPLHDDEAECLNYECRQLGVDAHVIFAGTYADPFPVYRAFDVFTMVSREDPYPLVTLEAAAMGIPVLCFEQAGGSADLVENDGGIVVPYLDTAAMADGILELLDSPERRSQLGDRIREKVTTRNEIEVVIPRVLNVIQRLLETDPESAFPAEQQRNSTSARL